MRSFALSKERKFGVELDPITSAMRTPQTLVPICIIPCNPTLLHLFVQSTNGIYIAEISREQINTGMQRGSMLMIYGGAILAVFCLELLLVRFGLI